MRKSRTFANFFERRGDVETWRRGDGKTGRREDGKTGRWEDGEAGRRMVRFRLNECTKCMT